MQQQMQSFSVFFMTSREMSSNDSCFVALWTFWTLTTSSEKCKCSISKGSLLTETALRVSRALNFDIDTFGKPLLGICFRVLQYSEIAATIR